MAIAPGSRLGSYEILSALGAGGMGEVYHARDTKLGREVAVKVLPEAFALDPDRVARFQREAKVLASQNEEFRIQNCSSKISPSGRSSPGKRAVVSTSPAARESSTGRSKRSPLRRYTRTTSISGSTTQYSTTPSRS